LRRVYTRAGLWASPGGGPRKEDSADDLGEQIVRAFVRRAVKILLWGLVLCLILMGVVLALLFMTSGTVQPMKYKLF